MAQVYEVWTDDDAEYAAQQHGAEDPAITADLDRYLGGDLSTGVRHLVEEESAPNNLTDGWHWFRNAELVTVQYRTTTDAEIGIDTEETT